MRGLSPWGYEPAGGDYSGHCESADDPTSAVPADRKSEAASDPEHELLRERQHVSLLANCISCEQEVREDREGIKPFAVVESVALRRSEVEDRAAPRTNLCDDGIARGDPMGIAAAVPSGGTGYVSGRRLIEREREHDRRDACEDVSAAQSARRRSDAGPGVPVSAGRC